MFFQLTLFFLLSLIALFGLVVGSFLNVVILRGIKGESLFGSSNWRSHCPACKHTLSAFDLIPVFSFLFLKSKCRYCHKKISWQYPLVEIGTASVFVLTSIYVFSLSMPTLLFLLILMLLWSIFSVLIVVFVTDLRWGLVPVNYVWWVLPAALLLRIFLNYPVSTSLTDLALLTSLDLFAALIVGLLFWGLYIATKRRGIGEGDIPLGFLLGLLVGFPGFLVALLLSFVTGALVSIVLICLRRKKISSTIPFGPFLISSMMISVIWGERLLSWYLGLLGGV